MVHLPPGYLALIIKNSCCSCFIFQKSSAAHIFSHASKADRCECSATYRRIHVCIINVYMCTQVYMYSCAIHIYELFQIFSHAWKADRWREQQELVGHESPALETGETPGRHLGPVFQNRIHFDFWRHGCLSFNAFIRVFSGLCLQPGIRACLYWRWWHFMPSFCPKVETGPRC